MLIELLILLLYFIVTISGGWAGAKLSKTPRPFWLTIQGSCLCIFLLITLIRHVPATYYYPGLLVLGQSQITEILLCGLIPLLFGILIPQLPQKRQRKLVFVFAAATTFYFGFFTELGFIAIRNRLSHLETWMDEDVCLQTTNYTCGAAAAVSALNELGIHADESTLAIASRTSPISGTTEYMLARGIEALYANEGISCRVQSFDRLEQLQGHCPVIAIVKLRFSVDHFAAVLDINESTVIIADPLSGKEELSCDDFAEKWRFAGIVVQRQL